MPPRRLTKLISLLSLPAGQRDGFDAPADPGDEIVSISVPMRLKRRGNETRIVLEGTAQQGGQRDMQLINALAKAHLYLRALMDGSNLTIMGIAERYGVSGPDVSRLLPLAFLSPKITEAILAGRQSPDVSVARLTRMLELPNAWQEQHKLFEL